MRVKDKLAYVTKLLIAMLLILGCRYTKTFQYSESIDKEKKKQTIEARYSVHNASNLKLKIGSAWVEEVCYYDDTHGFEPKDYQRTFVFEIVNFNGIALDSVWKYLSMEINDSSMNHFEMEIGRYRLIGKKVWYNFPLILNLDVPKEILVNVFEREDQKKKRFLITIRFNLVDSTDGANRDSKH